VPGGPLVDDRAGGVGVGVVDDGQQLLEVRLPVQPLLAEEPVRRRQLDPLAALDGLPGVTDDVLDLLAGPAAGAVRRELERDRDRVRRDREVAALGRDGGVQPGGEVGRPGRQFGS
jgi:hypothetical protein